MSDKEQNSVYSKGMATRRQILGNAHVERMEAGKTDFDEPFQTLITEAAWGNVWTRPQITKREKSMLTIALLAALGHFEEMELHIRATVNTGASPDDIRETLLHVAIYAGVPAANQAIKIAKKTLMDMEVPGENE